MIYAATGSHANYFGSARTSVEAPARASAATTPATPTREFPSRRRCCRARPGLTLGAVCLVGVRRSLGPEGERHQQRPNRAGHETSVVRADRVGRWPAGREPEVPEVPSTLGLSATSFFCGAVTQGAILLNWAIVHPVALPPRVAALAAAALAAVGRTTWRPPDPRPLRTERGRRTDLPGRPAPLRAQPRDVHGDGRDLRAREPRNGWDPVGVFSISRASGRLWRWTGATEP